MTKTLCCCGKVPPSSISSQSLSHLSFTPGDCFPCRTMPEKYTVSISGVVFPKFVSDPSDPNYSYLGSAGRFSIDGSSAIHPIDTVFPKVERGRDNSEWRLTLSTQYFLSTSDMTWLDFNGDHLFRIRNFSGFTQPDLLDDLGLVRGTYQCFPNVGDGSFFQGICSPQAPIFGANIDCSNPDPSGAQSYLFANGYCYFSRWLTGTVNCGHKLTMITNVLRCPYGVDNRGGNDCTGGGIFNTNHWQHYSPYPDVGSRVVTLTFLLNGVKVSLDSGNNDSLVYSLFRTSTEELDCTKSMTLTLEPLNPSSVFLGSGYTIPNEITLSPV